MHHLARRDFLLSSAALFAAPAFAQGSGWDAVIDQARALEQCNAIAIRIGGTEVVSEVFRGPSIGQAVPVKSVSKTIVAALTGTALDRGEIPSRTSTLSELAPQLVPPGAEPGVGALTVEQLLTMRMGLERTSGANYGNWVSSPNWVADALSRPFVAEPGGRMLYSTGAFHILGAVLTEVTGQSLLALARDRLGEPLDVEIPAWTRDPQGRYLGGNEMSLSLPAMLRFGEMYRLGGTWQGRQILSAAWVKQSFVPRTRSPYSGLGYGYGWFIGKAGGDDYALARGYGGQLICVVPSLKLTMALTSDPKLPARSDGHFGDLMRLFEQAVIPAARRELG
ncbi:serine hydrolase domain-containing protein [Halovulum sp. GXIMD14794]